MAKKAPDKEKAKDKDLAAQIDKAQKERTETKKAKTKLKESNTENAVAELTDEEVFDAIFNHPALRQPKTNYRLNVKALRRL